MLLKIEVTTVLILINITFKSMDWNRFEITHYRHISSKTSLLVFEFDKLFQQIMYMRIHKAQCLSLENANPLRIETLPVQMIHMVMI